MRKGTDACATRSHVPIDTSWTTTRCRSTHARKKIGQPSSPPTHTRYVTGSGPKWTEVDRNTHGPEQSLWIRAFGILTAYVGLYYLQAVRHNLVPIFRGSGGPLEGPLMNVPSLAFYPTLGPPSRDGGATVVPIAAACQRCGGRWSWAVGVDAADFDGPLSVRVEQRRLQSLGALRRRVHRRRWHCTHGSMALSTASTPLQSATLPAPIEVDPRRMVPPLTRD
jgi:hypothetical protein